MKRWENLTIDGKIFKVDTKNTASYPSKISFLTVDDVYGRPSQTKRAIFDSWDNWFRKNGGYCEIDSYNTFQFTLKGVVQDEVGKFYKAYITSTRQELTPIV